MRKILFFFVFIPVVIAAQSKKDGLNFNYSSLGISDSLKKEANTVYRLDEGIVDVAAPGKYTFIVHQIFTILNSEGDRHLRQVYGFDKFHKIDNIEIKVFNKLGVQVEKYKKKDFSITAAFDGFSLITDDQVMRLQVSAPEYPCTIEVTYTQEVTSFITLPSWFFLPEGVSVEVSRFLIKVPAELDIHYKAKDINITPVITNQNSKKNYLWEINNLTAKRSQPGAGEFAKNPRLLIAANQFEYDGHRGDMSEWKGMGLWYNDLVKSTNQLSEAYKSQIRNLVSGVDNNVEKIRILYDYLQKNFRYVSIQLGIGGFKPFTADFVHEKKYGDCKALSNYMEACLNAINIKSYSAWINAGAEKSPVDPDFPYDGFNHQILFVPMEKDTIWLECTSSSTDFAHLGNFTENRIALVLTEKGGVLIPTPKSKSYENKFTLTTTVNINEDGSANTDGLMITTGEYKYEQFAISQEKKGLQKQYFVNGLGFPNPDELELSFGEKNINPFNTRIKMKIEKINDFMSGSKMFLRPRIYKIWSSKLPSSENRTEDFLFECPFEKTDTTIFKLPAGYAVDALPKEKQIKFEYGSYNTKYLYDDQQKTIIITAKLVLIQYHIPAEQYASAKKFFDEVMTDDLQKIVIKKE
jgi:hypothetical protein